MTQRLEVHDDFVQATIPGRYVLEMVASQPGRGLDLLEEADIAVDSLSTPGYRVSGAQMATLHHALVRRSDDELYGIFRRPVPRGSYAAFVRQATGYRDLRAVFIGAIEFYGLFDGHEPWSLGVRGRTATVRVRPRTKVQRQSLVYNHTMLLSVTRTACWLIDEVLEFVEVGLDRRFADYASETRFLFGVDPRRVAGPSYIRFDASMLDIPLRQTREAAAEWTRKASFEALIGRSPRGSLETRVRTALARTARVGDATLPDVARSLGLSKQTLARHLRERGLTFREIKDAVRHDHAVARLVRGDSVADVAQALGFSEASAFARAFKSWTGVPPSHYREGR